MGLKSRKLRTLVSSGGVESPKEITGVHRALNGSITLWATPLASQALYFVSPHSQARVVKKILPVASNPQDTPGLVRPQPLICDDQSSIQGK
jgi:hypothetical protein